MITPEENQFDDLLRDAFKGFRSEPDASVWPGIEAAVRPQPPTLWQRLRPVGLGVFIGAFMMGLVPHDKANRLGQEGQPTSATHASTAPASAPISAPVSASLPTLPAATVAPVTTPALAAAPALTAPVKAAPVRVTHFQTNSTPSVSVDPTRVSTPTVTLPSVATPGIAVAPTVPVGLTNYSGSLSAGVSGNGVGSDGGNVVGNVSPPMDSVAHPAPVSVMTRPWQAGFGLDTALHTALTRQVLPERMTDNGPESTTASASAASISSLDSTEKTRIRRLLLAEAVVLQTLTQRNDSLLRTLSEEPVRAPVIVAALMTDTDTTAAADLPPNRLPVPQPWGLMVAGELMPGWGTLPGYDEHTTEKLGPSRALSVSLTRQLTDRWRLRAGVGEAVARTQLDYQREKIGQTVRFDTTQTLQTDVHASYDTTFMVQVTSVMHLEPVLNNIGQIIGYDTSYIAVRDTSYQVVISHDTLRTYRNTVTNRIDTWRERQNLRLRPEYRFWTLPFAGQYVLLTRGRLRLGVSAGGQVLFFRGGTRPTRRGDEYVLEKVGPRDGPFRPVSLAWQSSADVEWRFTPRLSASVAPGLRGWAIRPERGLSKGARPLPSVQVGLIWGF